MCYHMMFSATDQYYLKRFHFFFYNIKFKVHFSELKLYETRGCRPKLG